MGNSLGSANRPPYTATVATALTDHRPPTGLTPG